MPNLSEKKRIEILKIYRSFSRPEILCIEYSYYALYFLEPS